MPGATRCRGSEKSVFFMSHSDPRGGTGVSVKKAAYPSVHPGAIVFVPWSMPREVSSMSAPNLLNQTSIADAVNEAGGAAYRLPPKHALAQLAATGCLSGTFYSDPEQQLDAVLQLVEQVQDNDFLARLAIYSRERALMKDMPVALA